MLAETHITRKFYHVNYLLTGKLTVAPKTIFVCAWDASGISEYLIDQIVAFKLLFDDKKAF